MRFTPQSDKEIAEANLWPIGIYSFEIGKAEDYTSQKGNDMIKLAVNVYNDEGQGRVVYDYLTDRMMYKLKHACEACGLEKAYDQGLLESVDFEGKTGKLNLGIKKDKSGQYPDSNSIIDYIKDAEATPHKAKQDAYVADVVDDEIPF